MQYEIVLTPKAEAQLNSITEALRGRVVEGMLELCESPTRLSRRSVSPPHPPGERLYEFAAREPIFGSLHHICTFRDIVNAMQPG